MLRRFHVGKARTMPLFRIRAQWSGPNGAQLGVADDTVECADACEALDSAVPGSWRTGEYTSATITIEPLPQDADLDHEAGFCEAVNAALDKF
jgi:hypothetical protein